MEKLIFIDILKKINYVLKIKKKKKKKMFNVKENNVKSYAKIFL